MPTIVLVRPGCTDFDEQHRVQGRLDIPLNARGAQQVHLIASELQDVPLDVLLAGPCEAARETALLLSKDRGLPVKVLEDLVNVDLGLWQGLCVDDLRRKHPRTFQKCQDCATTVCPPEGETLQEAAERVSAVLARPLRKGLNFGIVVPEPLAGIVRCVVQGRPLDEVDWLGRPSRLWEILKSSPAEPTDEGSGFFRRFTRSSTASVAAVAAAGVPHEHRSEAGGRTQP